MLQRCLTIYVLFMMALAALSWYIGPKLNQYSEEELAFGRSYATELLQELEEVAEGARQLAGESRTRRCDYYLDGEDRFRRLKEAAIHMKGEQGEDLVYALALAEDWCRQAAEFSYHNDNQRAGLIAVERYRQARAALLIVQVKEYPLRFSGR